MYIKIAQILSVDTKNLDGGRGSAPDAPDSARGAHDAIYTPKKTFIAPPQKTNFWLRPC